MCEVERAVDELQRATARLRDLGRSRPTAKRRVEVEGLLDSKWEGVQVSAARVLGAWGGPESVAALRSWLDRGRANRNWTVTHVAVEALADCVTAEDVGWALDLHSQLFLDGWGITSWQLVIGLPRGPTIEQLQRQARPTSSKRGPAEVALRWIADRDRWLAEHPDVPTWDRVR